MACSESLSPRPHDIRAHTHTERRAPAWIYSTPSCDGASALWASAHTGVAGFRCEPLREDVAVPGALDGPGQQAEVHAAHEVAVLLGEFGTRSRVAARAPRPRRSPTLASPRRASAPGLDTGARASRRPSRVVAAWDGHRARRGGAVEARTTTSVGRRRERPTGRPSRSASRRRPACSPLARRGCRTVVSGGVVTAAPGVSS
jgi:hypothetical protein